MQLSESCPAAAFFCCPCCCPCCCCAPNQATEALRITAPELIKLEVMDEVIPEPLGGAHRSAQQQQAHRPACTTQLISCTRTQEACNVCVQLVFVSRLNGVIATC